MLLFSDRHVHVGKGCRAVSAAGDVQFNGADVARIDATVGKSLNVSSNFYNSDGFTEYLSTNSDGRH